MISSAKLFKDIKICEIRITTDEETKFGEFPWMAAILEGKNSKLYILYSNAKQKMSKLFHQILEVERNFYVVEV